MKKRHGFIEMVNPEDIKQCEDVKCSREIQADEKCMFDTEQNVLYCMTCGNCERYSRKKAKERASNVLH